MFSAILARIARHRSFKFVLFKWFCCFSWLEAWPRIILGRDTTLKVKLNRNWIAICCCQEFRVELFLLLTQTTLGLQNASAGVSLVLHSNLFLFWTRCASRLGPTLVFKTSISIEVLATHNFRYNKLILVLFNCCVFYTVILWCVGSRINSIINTCAVIVCQIISTYRLQLQISKFCKLLLRTVQRLLFRRKMLLFGCLNFLRRPLSLLSFKHGQPGQRGCRLLIFLLRLALRDL